MLIERCETRPLAPVAAEAAACGAGSGKRRGPHQVGAVALTGLGQVPGCFSGRAGHPDRGVFVQQ